MDKLLGFFKRGRQGGTGDEGPEGPEGPEEEAQLHRGPCLRCGETAILNGRLFCYTCWRKAADLAHWAIDKKQELGITQLKDGDMVEVQIIEWSYVLAAKFPRDAGPDPDYPTFPATVIPRGAYWQPEGGRPDPETDIVRGICSCHFYLWN